MSTPTDNPFLDCIDRGFWVLPIYPIRDGVCACYKGAACRTPGKHPLTALVAHGFENATDDPAVIRDWLAQWPDANVGIATGKASNLLVIDFDLDADGVMGELPEAYNPGAVVRTGGGGQQFYYAYPDNLPDGIKIGCSVKKIAPGVDVRAEDGVVVAPPSVSGKGAYMWLRPPEDGPLPPPPPELVNALVEYERSKQRHTPPTPPPSLTDAQATAVIHRLLSDALTKASYGSRHATGVWLAQQLHDTGLPKDAVTEALLTYGQTVAGLGPDPESDADWLAMLDWAYAQSLRDPPYVAQNVAAPQNIASHEAEPRDAAAVAYPTIQTADQLMLEDIPPLRWVVGNDRDGLLAEGVALLAGKPKARKSYLLLRLGLDVASGGTVFGTYPTQQCGVLYLALEDSPRRVQDRIHQVWGDQPVPANYYIHYDWKRLVEADGDSTGFNWLDAFLTDHPEVKLVMVDTLQMIRPPVRSKANAYVEDYRAIALFKRLASTHHAAIVLCHHLSKRDSDDSADKVSGSTGLTGAVDTILVLQLQSDTTAALYRKGRDIGGDDLALTWKTDPWRWEAGGLATDLSLTAERREVLAVLRRAGSLKAGEIAATLGRDPLAVRQLLRRMTAVGQVYRAVYGVYCVGSAEEAA